LSKRRAVPALDFLAICCLVLCGFAFAQSTVVEPVREYFRYRREVAISQPGRQNYLAIDAAIWAHVRSDLSAAGAPSSISMWEARPSTTRCSFI
jgi:hypothetical protein